jgi:hypothetical protein
MLNNWLLNLLATKQKPPSSACLDGGSLTSFVAQRSYPDLGLGFLSCFFCLLSNMCFSLFYSASQRFNCIAFPNKKPACPGGFVRVVDALETKNPGLRSGCASWFSWRAKYST